MTRLIDADALETHEMYDGQGFTQVVYKDDIDEAPTIEERQYGEWDFVQHGKWVDLVCPFCKRVHIDGIAYNYSIDELKKDIEAGTFSIHGKLDLPNFCEECGADMRGEVE